MWKGGEVGESNGDSEVRCEASEDVPLCPLITTVEGRDGVPAGVGDTKPSLLTLLSRRVVPNSRGGE